MRQRYRAPKIEIVLVETDHSLNSYVWNKYCNKKNTTSSVNIHHKEVLSSPFKNAE